MLARLSQLPAVWLTALFGVLTLAPLLLLAYFAISRSTAAVEREATARVEATASLSADSVRTELDGLTVLVNAYANRPSLIAALAHERRTPADREQIAFHLSALASEHEGTALSLLATPSGRLVDIVPATPSIIGDDLSYRDWYRGVTATGRTYVSEAYVTAATGHDRVVAAASLVRGGSPTRTLAILVAGYDFERVEQFVTGFARRQGVSLTVTDQAGVVVASPGHPPRGLVSIAREPGVGAALRGDASSSTHSGPDGDEVAAYVPVEVYGWTVTASVPRESAFASVQRLRRTVLWVTTFLALVLAAWVAKLGLALRRRAELERRLNAEKTRVETLYGFTDRLAREMDVDALAAIALEQVAAIAGAEAGTLRLRSADGGLAVAATYGGADGRASPGGRLELPLAHGARSLGILSLRRASGDFSERDREAVEHLADQASVALANALALRDVQRLADVNRAVLDATTEAIRMIDLDGRTVLVNAATRELGGGALAVGNEVSIWESAAELSQRTTDPAAFVDALERLRRDPGRETIDLYQLVESGVWIQRYSGPVRNADGSVVGRIFVLRDITAERQVQQLKSDLVATVSHELRTPLTGILGFAELLARGDEDEDSRKLYVATIQNEAKRLRDLINDFLDLQRIEAGDFRLTLAPIELAEVIREQSALFDAQSAEHTVDAEIADAIPVLGERDRIAQVLANLLSNAIKYSPAGGAVQVRALRAGTAVRVEVADPGLGIPAAQQHRIFERFFRVDSSDTRRIGGTGLGLAVSRDLVEAHGGKIGFSSTEGAGSTFWFELPLVEHDTDAPAPRRAVLVVENRPRIVALLDDHLTAHGYAVETSQTGEEALARVEQSQPAVICLDLGIAGRVDGWELLTHLKSTAATATIPVVVCSGRRLERAVALGATDFVTKPFSRERLLEAVTRVVPRGGSILVVDDEATIRRLVATTLADDGLDVREAADGIEALQRVAEQRPDVIVLDLSMPGLDGFGVLERLGEQPETRSIRVIVLTAKHVTADERRWLRERAITVVDKSAYSAHELRRLVREAAA